MISFIYFDVGGVVIQDFSSTDNWDKLKREDLKLTEQKIAIFDQFWEQHGEKVGTTIDVDDLGQLLSLPESFSILDQFVKRFKQNPSLWPILQSLKQSHSIGLLTDMYPRMLNKIKTASLLPPLEWNVIIDSSVEKVRKPYPEIYQIAETRAKVNPQDILFVDNVQKNLDPAAARGWQTFLYDSANYPQSTQQLELFLKQRGL